MPTTPILKILVKVCDRSTLPTRVGFLNLIQWDADVGEILMIVAPYFVLMQLAGTQLNGTGRGRAHTVAVISNP